MWNLLGRDAPILIRDALSNNILRNIRYCMQYTVKVPAPGFVWLLKDFAFPRALYLPVARPVLVIGGLASIIRY